MKYLSVLFLIATAPAAFAANSYSRGAALDAAEAKYGNSPALSSIVTVGYDQAKQLVQYYISVGEGNTEVGTYYYEVTINMQGAPKPSVKKLSETVFDNFVKKLTAN